MHEKTSLNKPNAPCSDDPDYSFTSCIFSFIAQTVGCQIHWVHTQTDKKFLKCKTKVEIIAFDTKLEEVQSMSGFDLTNMTKCPISCRVRHFSFAKCVATKVTWNHEESSTFYLSAEKTELRQEEEFWIFDLSDTINGIGGAMGLFLGWSILYIIHQIIAGLNKAFTYFVSPRLKNKNQKVKVIGIAKLGLPY